MELGRGPEQGPEQGSVGAITPMTGACWLETGFSWKSPEVERVALQDVLLLGDPRRQQGPVPDDGLVWRCRARGPGYASVGFWAGDAGIATVNLAGAL